MLDAGLEFFRMSNNQEFEELLSARLKEDLNLSHQNY